MSNRQPATLVPKKSFPGHNLSDKEKAKSTFGLQVGQAIQYEWFKTSGNSCKYYDRYNDFHLLRLYARGEQPVDIYKRQVAVDGDLSKLNINWKPIPTMSKYIDVVVNGMHSRMFTPKAQAVDSQSTELRMQYQENLERDMYAKDWLLQTREEFGIDAFTTDPEELPETDEEKELHMQMKYKPAIEIAEEVAIDSIFKINDFDKTRWRYDYDITTIGMGVCKHWYCTQKGIVIDWVDPAEVVHSYTEDPYFKDVFYWGEVKQIHKTELRKINPDLTDKDIEEIAEGSVQWANQYSKYNKYQDSAFQKEVVNVLFFNYKTDKKIVHKEKYLPQGGSRMIEKDDTFEGPSGDDAPFGKVSKTLDVWYEGVMVLGSDKILKWELMSNMVKPDSSFQDVKPNYIAVAPRMYKGSIESIGRRMVEFADLLQLIHIKIQQVAARVVPDGVFIDADGLTGVDLGNGAVYSPSEALKLYFQTGSVVGRSYTEDGEFNNARIPIQELTSNSGQHKLSALISTYNHYLNEIGNITGINSARAAESPDPDALVGVQKLAALNSNIATKHILMAGQAMVKELAEAVSERISDVLKFAPNRNEFANMIGQYKVNVLEDIKRLHLHSFGIFIEVSPDEDEKARLEDNINFAIKANQIDLSDAIDIRKASNIKIANELLKLKQKQKYKRDQQAEQMKAQIQNQMNIQSQQAAAEAKMQEKQFESQSKIAVVQAETEGKIAQMQYEVEAKKQLMDLEYQYKVKIAELQATSEKDKVVYDNDRKDKRTEIQASQQAKMIDQRHNNLPPVDFESNEDSMDGITLSEYNPR